MRIGLPDPRLAQITAEVLEWARLTHVIGGCAAGVE
jgi:hypothetical protein